MLEDRELLRRWVRQRDAQAFAGLVERHAGHVYAVCRRITGDHHAAEDLAQDCLLEFARTASAVRRSVAGYLHRLATSRAVNRLRADARRRRHEGLAADDPSRTADGADANGHWRELEPVLDQALAAMPDTQRVVLVTHFLEGRSQVETAALLGLSQPTVSRRIEAGLTALRRRLAAGGAVLSLSTLTATLHAAPVDTAPPRLLDLGGKIALGAGRTGLSATAIATAIGVLLLVGSVGVVLVWPERPAPTIPAATTAPPPPITPPASQETTMIDPDDFAVNGQIYIDDSFVACLDAVLQAWQRPMPRDRLVAYSGLAFATPWNGDESTHWATWGGGEYGLIALGRTLGLTYRVLSSDPDRWLPPDWPTERFVDRGAMLAEARAADADGAVVLLMTWPTWSVISGWTDGSPEIVTFAAMERFTRRIWGPDKADLAVVLRPTGTPLNEDAALTRTLELARERVADSYRLAEDGGVERPVYADAAYRACARRLTAGRFCPTCDDDRGCYGNVLEATLSHHRSAVAFLDAAIDRLGDADGRLARARDAYHALVDRQATLLAREPWREANPSDELIAAFAELAEMQRIAGSMLRGD